MAVKQVFLCFSQICKYIIFFVNDLACAQYKSLAYIKLIFHFLDLLSVVAFASSADLICAPHDILVHVGADVDVVLSLT